MNKYDLIIGFSIVLFLYFMGIKIFSIDWWGAMLMLNIIIGVTRLESRKFK
jgi:hypothetical protein